jgi:hypothetical protein
MMMNRMDRGRREYTALIGAPPEEALDEVRRRSPHVALSGTSS